jgi:DNA-directed RNA polymerase subunit RPC12/RpoP
MFDANFHHFAYIFFIFLAPCQIFLLMRPEVKLYFGKGIVQTKDREIYTFNKMTTKTIKCPDCGKIQEVQGILGERVEVTCKKCNSKGFVNFR